MKAKIFTVFFFICCFAASKAGSVVGAQISYRYMGADKYEVTATCYRDCNGSLISFVPVDIYCSSGSSTANLSLAGVREVSGFPASCLSQTVCSGGSFAYGVEEYTYKGTIDLSAYTCCQVRLSWSLSARVTATNLNNVVYNYVYAIINKCTPTSFSWTTAAPSPLIRVSEEANLSLGGVDTIDNDSIAYELVDVLDAYGSPASYKSNYTGLRPFNFLGFPNYSLQLPAGFHIDWLGNVGFRPTVNNQTAYIAVKATEWRIIGGVPTQVGENYRNFAVTVIGSSGDKVPSLPEKTTFKACVVENNCFQINASDADANDTLDIYWDTALSNATLQRPGGITSRTVQLCWTPDSSELSKGPHPFTLYTVDRRCIYSARNMRTYSVMATTKIADTSKIIITKSCNNLLVKVKRGGIGSGFFYYRLAVTGQNLSIDKFADSISTAVQDTGWKKITLTITSTNYCNTQVYYDSVYYSPTDVVKPFAGKDTMTCGSNKITLSGSAQFGTAPYTYIWIGFGAGQTLNASLPTNFNAIRLNVTDSKGCTGSDTVQVNYSAPKIIPSYTDSITCTRRIFSYSTSSAVSPVTVIKNIDSTFYNYTMGGHIFNNFKKDFGIMDGLGCKDSVTVHNYVSVVSSGVPSSSPACEGDTVEFKIDSLQVNRPAKFLWQDGDTTETIRVVIPKTGVTYFLTKGVQLWDAYNCKATFGISHQSSPPPQMLLFPLADKCEKSAPVALFLYTATGGTWTGPGIVNDTMFDPSKAGPGAHRLVCHYTDTMTGCSNTDSLSVKVVKPLVAGFSADKTTVKPGTPITFTADNGVTGDWDFGAPSNPANNQIGKTAVISYADTGFYTVTMRTTMNGPCTADVSTKTNYIHVTIATGIRDAEKAIISVYPNPAGSLLHIVSDRAIEQISLSDIQGKMVYTEPAGGKTNTEIDVSHLSAGIYLLKVLDDKNTVSVIKISVQP